MSHTAAGLVIATDIEVVKATFAAFAARDVEACWPCHAPDIEFAAVTGEHAGRTEPYRGHDGMRQYFRDVASVWEELRLIPREFRPSGDLILVTGRVSRALPQPHRDRLDRLDLAGADGKVVYVRVYASAAEAMAAFEDDAGSDPARGLTSPLSLPTGRGVGGAAGSASPRAPGAPRRHRRRRRAGRRSP